MGGMSTLSVQSIENPKLVEINLMTHLSETNAKKPVGNDPKTSLFDLGRFW